MATGGRKVRFSVGDQPRWGGRGFHPGAHNASVKGAPKVLLSIFVTDD